MLVETGTPICFPYNITKEYALYNYDGHAYWGFKDYDSILRAWYGDYMTPPPDSERVRPEHRFVHFYYKDEI